MRDCRPTFLCVLLPERPHPPRDIAQGLHIVSIKTKRVQCRLNQRTRFTIGGLSNRAKQPPTSNDYWMQWKVMRHRDLPSGVSTDAIDEDVEIVSLATEIGEYSRTVVQNLVKSCKPISTTTSRCFASLHRSWVPLDHWLRSVSSTFTAQFPPRSAMSNPFWLGRFIARDQRWVRTFYH